MDIKAGSEVAGEGRVHTLIDVTQVPFEELLASDESVLASALRRVLAELDLNQEIIAGFGSYAE